MVEQITAEQAPCWVAKRLADPAVRAAGGTRWVGVDGLGGSGKTTLAAAVAAAIPGAVVVSVDDFSRPGVPAWDRDLFTAALVGPLQAGRPGRYQRWDLERDVPLGWIEVPPDRVVLVEGVSATDERLGLDWSLTLWVDASAAVRRSRILARDGAALLGRWQTDWWPSEEAYAQTQRPWQRVDAVVSA